MNEDEIKRITDYIFLEDTDKSADIALVFGTMYWQYPLQKVLGLYRSNLIRGVIFSGGINRHSGKNEARKMAKEAVKSGIQETDIMIEDKSINTLENVRFSKEILAREIGFENIRSIVAIVKHYHSRRALMTMKRHLPQCIILKSCPYQLFDFTKENWHLSEKGREKVLQELDKIRVYLAKGNLAEI